MPDHSNLASKVERKPGNQYLENLSPSSLKSQLPLCSLCSLTSSVVPAAGREAADSSLPLLHPQSPAYFACFWIKCALKGKQTPFAFSVYGTVRVKCSH